MNRNKTVSLMTFAVALLLFSSCRTGRQVVVVEARDSVRVEERVREIKVTDTLFVAVPMQKESTTVRDSMSHLENDYAVSDARIMIDGSLYHSLETNPAPTPLHKSCPYKRKIRLSTVRKWCRRSFPSKRN